MPFAKNWSEELIAEWLNLKGYTVEVSVPCGTGRVGGRAEADVVGIKLKSADNEPILEICHIEVDSSSRSKKRIMEVIKNKFSKEREQQIKKYFGLIEDKVKVEYKKIFILLNISNITKKENNTRVDILQDSEVLNYRDIENVEIINMDSFIKTYILPSMIEWKENPPYNTKTKGKDLTLPDSLWLLQLIDFFIKYKYIKLLKYDKKFNTKKEEMKKNETR